MSKVSEAHSLLAKGLSNEKVQYKGVVKNGFSEMLAVQHRKAQVGGLYSAMLGIVLGNANENGTIVCESRYRAGVVQAVAIAFETFKAIQEKNTSQ